MIKKGMKIRMKRRKMVGLILFCATVVYLFAFVLSVYQNQRVQLEKEMQETLKYYSQKEEQSVKELSKDMNTLLDEKLDKNDMEQQMHITEGNFERIDKNVSNVTEGMVVLEKNITNLSDLISSVENHFNNLNEKVIHMGQITEVLDNRLYQIEELYSALCEEIINYNAVLSNDITQNKEQLVELQKQLADLNEDITNIEKSISEENIKKDEQIKTLEVKLSQCEARIKDLVENVLYYRFDAESNTLQVYGNQGGEAVNE